MEEYSVISKIDEPTDRCSGMVVVPKANGDVRISVDLTKLNESVHRECHILPSVELTLGQLGEAKVFSKLDVGFDRLSWLVNHLSSPPLLPHLVDSASTGLPFGITSAPKYYQKKMSAILTGIPEVVCMINDILVFGWRLHKSGGCLEMDPRGGRYPQ